MSLEQLWAGWRNEYVTSPAADEEGGCVLCRLEAADVDTARVVWRGEHAMVALNAYPYTSGHVMIFPSRHVAELEDLTPDEESQLWRAIVDATRTIKQVYSPGGVNVGANIGRAAGAGVPGHLHWHALPRWAGDTNFMTSVADTRVLNEALTVTWERLRSAWPG